MSATRCVLLAVLLIGSFGCSQSGSSSGPRPKSAEALLDNVERTLADLPAYSCKLAMKMRVKTQGMDNNMDSDYDVRVEKPNRWSIVMNSGMMGGTSVSDGREVITYLPMLKKYTVQSVAEGELPESGPAESMALLGPAAFAQAFFGDGLKDVFMAGVDDATIVGADDVEGDPCWHAKFEQDHLNWELWTTQGEQPLLRRLVLKPDFGAAGAQMGERLKGMSMEVHIDFEDWDTDPEFTNDDFAFVPPNYATKSDSLFGGLGGRDEGPHPLVGEPAPEFEADQLDGDAFKLADVLKEKVVMLDFWATWCGPCVDALPQVAAAAKELEDEGVVFFAVNIQEEADSVRKFLKSKELEPPVLLDADGDIAKRYGATAIPQTVIIGKDGRVQVVHVGGSSNMKQMLLKDLRKLLNGEDLAAATVRKAKEQEESAAKEAGVPIEPKNLTPAWTKKGNYTGAAVDHSTGIIYALRADAIQPFDVDGKELDEISLDVQGRILRLASFDEDKSPEFLVFQPWGGDLAALDHDGKQLWTYPRGQGLDDVWAADLDGDGRDEVVVGYNGSTGLHVVDSQGKERWKTTTIGNVWHVAAGPFTLADAAEVITTSAAGQVHVFDGDGEPVNDIKVSLYANGIRMAPSSDDKPARALVTGSANDGESMVLLNGEGEELWKTRLPSANDHVDSLAVDAEGQYAAVGMRGGIAYVVELADGKIVGSVGGQGETPDVSLLTRAEKYPLLLVANSRELAAFELAPDKDVEADGDEDDGP